MTRMLFPALILAGPATAHTDPHIHAHGSDYGTLGIGLAVIALIAAAFVLKLPK